MKAMYVARWLAGFLVSLLIACAGLAHAAEPVTILNLPGTGGDPARIDYAKLPRLGGEHTVISAAERNTDAAVSENLPTAYRFELHNYLIRYDGKFWCTWSDGPRVEDEPTQEVRFATAATRGSTSRC
jgi:hypothetical protein